jgi:hypothetical protein
VHEKFFSRLLLDAFDPLKGMEECVHLLSRRRHFSLTVPLFEAPLTSAAAQEMILPALLIFFAMLSDPPTKDFHWLSDLSVSLLRLPFANALVEFCDFAEWLSH